MTGQSFIEINGRKIGVGYSTYIVAELSANHNQDIQLAKDMIHAAKDAGADAVKLQTYTPDTITIQSDKDYFKIKGGTLWDGHTLYDLYGKAFTPWEWQPELKTLADKLQIDLFSSPFDETAVDFLEEMDVPAHKVASFELIDHPLIEKIAKTGKPMIMSSGMATYDEIEEAVAVARKAGAEHVAVLKCVSSYPAPPESMNLKTISYLQDQLNVPIGLSDHTLGWNVATAAVALGACIIEKHITLSRKIETADSAFSLEPEELKGLVEAVRVAEKALGSVKFGSDEEDKSRVFRRSLFAVSDIKKGMPFTAKNVRSIRPAHGLAPKHYREILGKKATADIQKGTPLDWSLVGGHD